MIKNHVELICQLNHSQISDEKEAIKQYGSKDSGASLGDILGEAFDKNSETQDDEIIEENKE